MLYCRCKGHARSLRCAESAGSQRCAPLTRSQWLLGRRPLRELSSAQLSSAGSAQLRARIRASERSEQTNGRTERASGWFAERNELGRCCVCSFARISKVRRRRRRCRLLCCAAVVVVVVVELCRQRRPNCQSCAAGGEQMLRRRIWVAELETEPAARSLACEPAQSLSVNGLERSMSERASGRTCASRLYSYFGPLADANAVDRRSPEVSLAIHLGRRVCVRASRTHWLRASRRHRRRRPRSSSLRSLQLRRATPTRTNAT